MPKPFNLGLALLLLFQSLQGGQKSTHSARVGDVQVTVIAARIASSQDIQEYVLHPRAGHTVVLVFLRVKNVARYPSCSHLDEWLHVKQGYEYPKSFGFKMNAPKTHNLLPTEESSGQFAFEIKSGTEPSSLKLVRNAIGEEFCATSQHRDTRISGPESVSLSLLGLPTHSEQSFAPITQLSANTQAKFGFEEQQSNLVLMNDGFEYRAVDYGFGRIQVRNQGTAKDFTELVFWVKFQITNKAENLIGNPRYFPSVLDALRVTDNWGNVYSLRYPSAADVGGNWYGAELPIPEGERRERYKPNESSWAVRLIPAGELVQGVKEFRIYLANQFDYPKFSFKVEEPMLRQQDLHRSQGEPNSDELKVKVVTERRVPSSR